MPQLQSPEIQAFANGFPIALMHIAVTVAILFIGVTVYVLMTPHREIALIREAECIGCTKCIQACPVDAILGATKAMHTVIEAECTGCDLCVDPCPTDCIEMIPVPTTVDNWKWDLAKVAIPVKIVE